MRCWLGLFSLLLSPSLYRSSFSLDQMCLFGIPMKSPSLNFWIGRIELSMGCRCWRFECAIKYLDKSIFLISVSTTWNVPKQSTINRKFTIAKSALYLRRSREFSMKVLMEVKNSPERNEMRKKPTKIGHCALNSPFSIQCLICSTCWWYVKELWLAWESK